MKTTILRLECPLRWQRELDLGTVFWSSTKRNNWQVNCFKRSSSQASKPNVSRYPRRCWDEASIMNRVEEVGLDQQVQAVYQLTKAGVSILPENDLVDVFDQ